MTTQTIPKGWTITTLGEVAEIIKDQWNPGDAEQKYIGLEHISQGDLRINGYGFSSKLESNKFCFKNGDVLFGKLRPYFRKVWMATFSGICSTDIWVIRSKKGYDQSYLFYFMANPIVIDKSSGASTGTKMPRADWGFLGNTEWGFPNISEQKAIAAVLAALDDKIELLRKQNKTLENIAQTLFKRWFVDFEFPCLPSGYAFGAGKPNEMASVCTYKSVGGLPAPQSDKHFLYVLLCGDDSFYIGITDDLYRRWYEHKTGKGAKWTKQNEPIKVIHWEEFGNKRDAAAREQWLKTGFGRKWLKREYEAGRLRQAGKMTDSALGKIPAGWRVGRLEDEFQIIMGQSPDGSSYNEDGNGMVFFQGRTDFQERFPVTRLYTTEPKRIAEKNDVLVSVRAPVGDINVAFERCCIGRGLGAVRGKHKSYTLYKIQSLKDAFQNFEAEGTVFGSINKDSFAGIEVIIPPAHCMEKFEVIASSVDQKIFNNTIQIKILSRLRDSLLSKLMKGELRVKL